MSPFSATLSRAFPLILAIGILFLATTESATAQVASPQDYGVGTGQYVGATNAAVFFMVGLIVGLIGGILLLFTALVRRERQTAEENYEFEALMEALDDAEGDLKTGENPFSSNPQQNPRSSAEMTEPVDPWERPADWWRKSDEDK